MNVTNPARKKLIICLLAGLASLIVLALGALALNGIAIQVGPTTAVSMAVAGVTGSVSSFSTLYAYRKR